ncbi:MAG: hypothetical protein ACXV5Q_12590 [Frankiaceae bacterium]
MEAAADPGLNAVAKELCEEALAGVQGSAHEALRARLLAQRSHLAFYDGDEDLTRTLSGHALAVARESGDDRTLVEALHARKEACPGPAGRDERLRLAAEMLTLAQRTGRARTAMWGELWRIEALLQSGCISAAAEKLATLQVAVGRVGGPVSAWHLDRVTACVAQAQARYADAKAIGRRGFDRMRAVEPRPARGAYFSLHCVLANHVGLSDDATEFVRRPTGSSLKRCRRSWPRCSAPSRPARRRSPVSPSYVRTCASRSPSGEAPPDGGIARRPAERFASSS